MTEDEMTFIFHQFYKVDFGLETHQEVMLMLLAKGLEKELKGYELLEWTKTESIGTLNYHLILDYMKDVGLL